MSSLIPNRLVRTRFPTTATIPTATNSQNTPRSSQPALSRLVGVRLPSNRSRSGGCGNETAPCCNSRAGERIRPLGRAGAHEKSKLPGERGRLECIDFAADDDRRAIYFGDESSRIGAEHEFPKEDVGLRGLSVRI